MGMIMTTMGTFLSGYVYNHNSSIPWYILSGVLVAMGVLFILLVKEPEKAEI